MCHRRLAPDFLSRQCTLLTSVDGRSQLRSAEANKLHVRRAIIYGPLLATSSFGITGPAAKNENAGPRADLADLTPSKLRQLLKTAF